MRKTIVSAILCLVILMLGFAGLTLLASLKKPPGAREKVEKVYNVEVFDAQENDLRVIISAFGSARADREVVLSARVAGEIVDVHPRLYVGEDVRSATVTLDESGQSRREQGELLVRIDPETYRERVTQAENRVAEAQAELNRLVQEERNNTRMVTKVKSDYEAFRLEYERVMDLQKQGVSTPSDVTRALLELRQFEESIIRYENEADLFPDRRAQILTRLESYKTDRKIAEIELEHAEVRAPFSGLLSEVMVEVGQYLRPGDPIVRVTDIGVVEIPISLTLSDYARIGPAVRAGKLPNVELAENETAPPRWTGYISYVAPKADELTRTIMAYVRVENSQQKVPLLPGTFVHARIEGPVLQKAVVIPRDSIVNGFVFVTRDGVCEKRRPSVVRTLQSLALLDGGVTAGEEVVLTNLDIIHDGAKVSVQEHRNLATELANQRVNYVRPVSTVDNSPAAESNELPTAD